MAVRKQTTSERKAFTLDDINVVKCEGCKFLVPYEDFTGHGFCGHRAVKMVVVIECTKKCIWRENG
jgi:hypothetical protein